MTLWVLFQSTLSHLWSTQSFHLMRNETKWSDVKWSSVSHGHTYCRLNNIINIKQCSSLKYSINLSHHDNVKHAVNVVRYESINPLKFGESWAEQFFHGRDLLRLKRFRTRNVVQERAGQRRRLLPPLDDDGLFMPPMKDPNGLLDAMLICILVFASL